jgi:hypothetical protein
MRDYVAAHRIETTPFDIVKEGRTPGENPVEGKRIVSGWAEAGATWWIEAMWDSMTGAEGREAVLRRIQQGPPRIS